jgi:DNA-binding GntR family transcriptional regulator
MLREPILLADSTATDEEQARLGLIPGEMVYRVARIRGHGGQLWMENVRLPAALFPRLHKPVPRIADLADAYGFQIGEALEQVSTIAASADIAKAIGTTEGTLLLISDRVVYLRDGRPAEWRVTYSLDQGNLARLIARL